MTPLKLQIIISSVRPNRFGDKPAAWIASLAPSAGFEIELIDLKDWQLPDYNELGSPNGLKGALVNPQGRAWNELLSKADAYLVVTPEYNHGYPGSLKNAIDWMYPSQSVGKKPVAFVGYGTVGGARAVEQLRTVAAELQMADIRSAVHIPMRGLTDEAGSLKEGALAPFEAGARAMLEELSWWSRALKVARESK